MGNGNTTAIACINTNRKFIGIEKDVELVKMSNKDNELFNKMDDFVNAYTDLSNAIFDVDYDFADGYPLQKILS